MIADSEKSKTISISEFKAHCTEQIRAVSEQGGTLAITRHGKVVAVVKPPEPDPAKAASTSLLGAGKGTATFSPDYDPHAPAFDEDEWEMNRE